MPGAACNALACCFCEQGQKPAVQASTSSHLVCIADQAEQLLGLLALPLRARRQLFGIAALELRQLCLGRPNRVGLLVVGTLLICQCN